MVLVLRALEVAGNPATDDGLTDRRQAEEASNGSSTKGRAIFNEE